MKKANLNIREASIDDLLSQVVNVSVKPRDYIIKWVDKSGVEPGQTRVLSSQLYAEYKVWLENEYKNSVEPVTITAFGQYMRTRFKNTHSKHGQQYWIRRGKPKK